MTTWDLTADAVAIAWLTPREAVKFAGMKSVRVFEDVAMRRGIARHGDLKNGKFVVAAYNTVDVVNKLQIRNWRVKLAIIELDRIEATNKEQ